MAKGAIRRRISSLLTWRKKLFPKRFSGKRKILSGSKQKRLLEFLEEKLAVRNFFDKLENVNPVKATVKKLDFEGVLVAIKNTWGSVKHGRDFSEIRSKFLLHQQMIRSGGLKAKYYKLRSIKVYGRVGDYIVMECLNGKNAIEIEKSKDSLKKDSFSQALDELSSNFSHLKESGLIDSVPQKFHLMTTGNTNPKNPKKGKWVLFLPYDYT